MEQDEMEQDAIHYDVLIENALRAVVRDVLTQVRDHGLPGDHHLLISFDTTAEGVQISKRLHEQYPEDMTVVLQYQFWDLAVSDEGFEVKLSFSNVPERLAVPFSAVKAFYDPSVQFGLQFTKPGAANDMAKQHLPSAVPDLVPASDEGHPDTFHLDNASPEVAKRSSDGNADVDAPAKIVELDRFRKK